MKDDPTNYTQRSVSPYNTEIIIPVTPPANDTHEPINGDGTKHPTVHSSNPRIFDDDLYYDITTSFAG